MNNGKGGKNHNLNDLSLQSFTWHVNVASIVVFDFGLNQRYVIKREGRKRYDKRKSFCLFTRKWKQVMNWIELRNVNVKEGEVERREKKNEIKTYKNANQINSCRNDNKFA